MKKILLSLLFCTLLVLLISSNVRYKVYNYIFPNQIVLDQCKSGLVVSPLYEKVINFVNRKDKNPISYIASKSTFSLGMGYYLLINYTNESYVVAANSRGMNFRRTSSKEGMKYYNLILENGYKNVNNIFGKPMEHSFCQFYRIYDSNEFYNFALVNSNGIINKPEYKISNEISQLFEHEISNYHKEGINNNTFYKFDLNRKAFDKDKFNDTLSHLNSNLFFEIGKIQ